MRTLFRLFKVIALIDRNVYFHLIEIIRKSSLLQAKIKNTDRDPSNEQLANLGCFHPVTLHPQN